MGGKPRQESGREQYSERERDYDKCHSIIARIEFRTAGGERDRGRLRKIKWLRREEMGWRLVEQ